MRIFVAGGTGVVGRPAVRLLVAAGHDVTAVARTEAKADYVRAMGATPVTVDLFDVERLREAVAGHDVAVNLATAIPPLSKALRASAWAMNERIRREASSNLVTAASAGGASRYIQESITFPYPDRGAEWIDESTPLEPTPLIAAVLAAEAAADRFAATGGAGVVLRFGAFYAPDASHTRDFVRFARRGIAPVVGRASGYLASIHADDAGAAVVAALDAPTGRWNVVDDNPVTRREFAAVLADAVGRRRLLRFPGRLGGLSRKTSLMARSQRVSNRRFRDSTGWAPDWPSIAAGWHGVVAAIDQEASRV